MGFLASKNSLKARSVLALKQIETKLLVIRGRITRIKKKKKDVCVCALYTHTNICTYIRGATIHNIHSVVRFNTLRFNTFSLFYIVFYFYWKMYF